MQIRQYIFTLLCIFLCTDAQATKLRLLKQGDTTDYSHVRLRYFFIEPIALIDPYSGPSLRLGTEFKVSKRYAVNVTAGTYFNLNSYMLKLEMKRYIALRQKYHYYLSLQYFYKDTHLPVNDVHDNLPKGSPGYDIRYKVNKYASYFNVNVGGVEFHRHHLLIECYAGLGLRYRNVALDNLSADNAIHRYHHKESMVDRLTNNNDKGWYPNFSLGLRFGIRY